MVSSRLPIGQWGRSKKRASDELLFIPRSPPVRPLCPIVTTDLGFLKVFSNNSLYPVCFASLPLTKSLEIYFLVTHIIGGKLLKYEFRKSIHCFVYSSLAHFRSRGLIVPIDRLDKFNQQKDGLVLL